MPKVAVVTGANKGIGFGIVRALCKQFDGVVYLTSRNVQLGEQAVKELQVHAQKGHCLKVVLLTFYSVFINVFNILIYILHK